MTRELNKLGKYQILATTGELATLYHIQEIQLVQAAWSFITSDLEHIAYDEDNYSALHHLLMEVN